MPFNPSETILDNLLARTKAEIDHLRKLLQADVKSNLNKADMAAEVADYIRHEGEFWIRRFPQRDIPSASRISTASYTTRASYFASSFPIRARASVMCCLLLIGILMEALPVSLSSTTISSMSFAVFSGEARVSTRLLKKDSP